MSDFKDPKLARTLEMLHQGGEQPPSILVKEEPDEGEIQESPQRMYSDSKMILRPDHTIKELYIHQSMVKKMIHSGTRADYCPLSIYMTHITGKYEFRRTDSMLYGLYFEAGCLNNGIGKDGKPILLERLRNGKKSTNNLRIDEQILNFKENVAPMLGLQIHPDTIWRQFNAQVTSKTIRQRFNFEVFIELETDILTKFVYDHFNDELAIVDLKLTINKDGCHGDYCWGTPENMDHIQAYMYSFTLGLPFYYLVFDYKPQDRGWKVVHVNTNMEHPDPKVSDQAKNKKKEMLQSIYTIAAEIEHNHKHGWKTNPISENCKGCPVPDCADRVKTKTI